MLVEFGSRGAVVRKIQKFIGTKVDGIFGIKTETKLKEWQTLQGLPADGIVDDLVWNKMFGTTDPIDPSGSSISTTIQFKLNKLIGVIPDLVIAQIQDTAIKFNISNTLRLSHFLSQCAHESAGFKLTVENLNYSAQGLANTFPKRYSMNPNEMKKVPNNLALSLHRKPEAIANNCYANRNGNGNELSGDGWRFRGRGYIQLTGRSNYLAFDKLNDDDIISNPDLVATKYPLSSAAFYFDKNGLWGLCDKGSSDQEVIDVTRRVNGGIIGLKDRKEQFHKIFNLLK
ncbi:MAG TPA: peptidoglycan-binding protein [Chitinophagaceae bacterium]|nr:peptidoglycan-binding protein [Chitinophagaceae bacterium]